MEIKHIVHTEINCQKWDTCIQNACNSLIYAESWYLDMASPNWEALICGDYEYVMPLPVKKKYGITFLVQPPLTQQLGVFSSHRIEENIIVQFIQKIPYRSYHLNLNEQNPYHKGIKQPNLILHLNKDYDTLFAAYSTNTKRNIKKAQQAGIYVLDNIQPEQFLKFYFSAINNDAKPNENLTANILKTGCQKEKLQLYAAYTAEHKLISVLCMLRAKGRLIYLLAASNETGKALSVMSLMVDNVIQNFADTHTIIDFEGSKVAGIARFYQGFGAETTTYLQIRRNSVLQFMNFLRRK